MHRKPNGIVVALGAVAALALAVGSARAGAPELQAVDLDGLRAARALPLPSLLHAPPVVPVSPSPGLDAPLARQLLDDFESPAWPDRTRWVIVADLNAALNGTYTWAPRDCRAAGGNRSLWAVGGGADGLALPCGSTYPDEAAASAVRYVDFSMFESAVRLDLVMDIWADAEPTEGLFINYVVFDPQGRATERRIVFSATGRPGAWVRGVRLDLTNLRDRLSPSWSRDLRGRNGYLEFLFVSHGGGVAGEGIFLDNLAVETVDATPQVVPPNPTPPPSVNRTIACTSGADCATLTVRAYVDTRCDGRYQAGLDQLVRSEPRVDVTAGAELLGTRLSLSGSAFFRLPISQGVELRFQVPDGYEMCPSAPNPVLFVARDFQPFGRKSLDLRIRRR